MPDPKEILRRLNYLTTLGGEPIQMPQKQEGGPTDVEILTAWVRKNYGIPDPQVIQGPGNTFVVANAPSLGVMNYSLDPSLRTSAQTRYKNLDRNTLADRLADFVEVDTNQSATGAYFRALEGMAAGGATAGTSGSSSVSFTPIAGKSEADLAASRLASYLEIAKLEDQRRQEATKLLAALMAYAVPPGMQYFPGFEPEGPLSYVYRVAGLPGFSGIPIQHRQIDLSSLFAPSPYIGPALEQILGMRPELSMPPVSLVQTGYSSSYGTSGGGGGGTTLGLQDAFVLPLVRGTLDYYLGSGGGE